jgi:hypothetical protein
MLTRARIGRHVRRGLAAVAAGAIAVFGLPAVSAHAAVPGTPMYCYQTLSCRASDFNAFSLDQRLSFLRALQDYPMQQFQSGFKDLRAIEGIIEFLKDHNLGAHNTWASYVDGGILEGIERGLAMATNPSAPNFGNNGANLWRTFLLDLKAGRLSDPVAHDREWGAAEQASTDRGTEIAGGIPVYATNLESNWFRFSQVFRWIMQNELTLYNLPVVGGLLRPALPNLTIVTDASRTYFWSTLAWSTSAGLTLFNDYITQNWLQLGWDLWTMLNTTCTSCQGGGQTPASLWSGPCSGYTCDDLDPTLSWNASTHGTCSANAYSVVAIGADNGTLQLRWGPNCSVNWARFIPNASGTWYYIWVGRQSPGWNTPGYEFLGSAGVAAYSNQVYAPGPARVCVLQWNGSTWTNQVCTNWY